VAFVSNAHAPVANPATSNTDYDDAIQSWTFYDGAGRALETRTQTGAGASAAGNATAHISQGLTAGYLVSAVVYDNAGRRTWALDPYYSTSFLFEDVSTNAPSTSVPEHATNTWYDAKSRPYCSMYQQVSGALSAGNSVCASTSTVRAVLTQYSTTSVNMPLRTVETFSDSQLAPGGNSGAVTAMLDASGQTRYGMDAEGNTTKTTHDPLGRVTQTTRMATGGATISSSSVYDKKGRVIVSQDDSAGVKIYTYSSTGQLLSVNGGRDPIRFDGAGREVSPAEASG
jgi:YD repeat-containing protein